MSNDFVCVVESPQPDSIYCISPGLARLPSGRLLVTTGFRGPGVQASAPTAEALLFRGGKRKVTFQGFAYRSDDRGASWTRCADYSLTQSRPFVAGDSVYIIGQCGDVGILRSRDNGDTWDGPYPLTEGGQWHQAPSNVWSAGGYVYLVMERETDPSMPAWPVSSIAPVLMRGKIGDDLTRRENWTFASELVFRDAVRAEELDGFGVPFYPSLQREMHSAAPGRTSAPIGWLETNVIQFPDPDHVWHDPTGHTFHLWMRAHTGRTGYAAIAKVVEREDGTMTTQLETAPSGKKMVFVPCPGGQMKFHLLYDEVSCLFWLLSTQATDSMTRADRLPPDRYGLPDNERRRLQLHFSRNAIDWCFAALVAQGETEKQSRHYASMVIDGDDLHIASRSGDERSKSAHDTNRITFHTVRDFRRLIY